MRYQRVLASCVILLAIAAAGCGGAQDRKAHYLDKGAKYLADGNYEKARIEYRNALQIDPTDSEARYQLGRVSEKLGDPREAVGHYQAAIDLDPKHMPSRAALARLYLLGGLPDKAMELVEPGLAQEPKNAQLLTVRGAAKAQLGDKPGAFEDAQAAVQLAPEDEYAVALLASLYRQDNQTDKAIEAVKAGLERIPKSTDLRVVLAELQLATEHPAEAEEQLKKVVELQPGELQHRYRLARFYVLTKNQQAAQSTLRDAIASVPDSIEAKLTLIDLLVATDGIDKAESELKKFVGDDRRNSALQLALARFYETHGKAAQAKAQYTAIINDQDKKPDGLTARTRLAAMLVQEKQLDPASKLIEEVLKENARDNEALALRGNLALARGDAAAAITDLRAVLRDQPNSIPIVRALARAHLQNNELALAEETLRSAAQANPGDRTLRLELSQLLTQSGRPEQAKPVLEQLVAETPNDVGSLEALFRVQAALKDLNGARTTAESIKRVRPDLPLGPFLLGTVEESQQKLDAATAEYENALVLQPRGAEPLTALIRVMLARKQPEQALARLDKVIAEQSDNAVPRNLKGELLTSRGRHDDAIAAFDGSITLSPQWWLPYRGLALAYLASKRTDPALATLERGVQQTGSAALATDLAALYERLNRPDDAIRVYEGMVKRNPASVAAANNLAMLLVSYRADQASLDRAQQLTARLNNVTEPAVLNTRGWVKFKRGEFQESLTLLQEAVDKSPESPLMRYHLGMAQLRTGDRNAARQNLEAALTSGRTFQGAKEAQAALAEIKRAG
ncbi:MAG TPA: tetratricopeptide repeat protein [Steroidobacteraceae bacterium]|nr:tetratricopeptide repeat protein [Steroidobacteraceae bacterium]